MLSITMLKLADYLALRKQRQDQARQFRVLCETCRQPNFSCYCPDVEAFDPRLQFAILIHPIESRRRIATGRMSHLSLHHSLLIEGQDFSHNPRVNALLKDPTKDCRILYPGPQSVNLSELSPLERQQHLPTLRNPARQPVIFVVDGTWATARKMIRQSQNLARLPRICFTPTTPSNFRVRKQPRPECYSTLEAIHHLLELIDPQRPEHQGLLNVFDKMVEKQLSFLRQSMAGTTASKTSRKVTYRREQNRKALMNLGLGPSDPPETPQPSSKSGIA
jgi:DTW domain-containing protein YfiP